MAFCGLPYTERTSDRMYNSGLVARLDDIIAGMLEMEVTRMFGSYGLLMNGHMCAGIWNDMLFIRIGTDG